MKIRNIKNIKHLFSSKNAVITVECPSCRYCMYLIDKNKKTPDNQPEITVGAVAPYAEDEGLGIFW